MKNKNLRKILYVCAVLVLLVLGIYVWMRSSGGGIVEEQTFTIHGKQTETFVYNTKTETPRMLHVKVEGELDCDAILVIKEDGEGNSVRFRRSFPLKAGELKDRDFQTSWTHSGMIIEFKANDCVVNNIKIVIGVEK
ncbi:MULTISPECIES: hypothetical protein [Odoribacteraceae]|uniref:hypothetical protein n=1 Tax=Odoribacteraceae TaxID=1853231 RepID=UPI000E4D29D9|nr:MULTISPECIES: hypothetical protein [Odoribacteraceae]MCQ4873873.1 hypothetical protein [Butyricimonas paravirosa]RHR79710.1 hypothetical protein DWW52_09025 [Odoribacter sp. AF15-53]